MTLQDIVQEARTLSIFERQQLIKVLVDTLSEPVISSKQHDLIELAGLGAEIWQGVDAQAYVNQLRDEWDERP